ncbi:YciI family protein [Micromonospora azadirachtae]|uniref:YciI family protein n=1 Tax=Micromonospora azadirachtae TaxID=1970735 RepID=A0ABW3A1K5_9ACTN
MKYMLLIYSGSADATDPCGVEDWMAFDKTVREAGIWVSGHSLADLTTATTVHVTDSGERAVTDGPFAESREVLGGYYVIDVPDLDIAVDWAARCPGSRGNGAVEVRPIGEF